MIESYPAHYPPCMDWVHVEKIDAYFAGKELRFRQIEDVGLG